MSTVQQIGAQMAHGGPHVLLQAGSGGSVADCRMADALQALIALDGRQQRLEWIERHLATTNDFPPPDAPRDQYRETLIRWWLCLYGTSTE